MRKSKARKLRAKHENDSQNRNPSGCPISRAQFAREVGFYGADTPLTLPLALFATPLLPPIPHTLVIPRAQRLSTITMQSHPEARVVRRRRTYATRYLPDFQSLVIHEAPSLRRRRTYAIAACAGTPGNSTCPSAPKKRGLQDGKKKARPKPCPFSIRVDPRESVARCLFL